MDDRQRALLARQPSAALQNRERFCGMPKRGLAFLLANVMFWQPMWAQADGIVVSAPGTSLGQAGNGVPIVNIATPNGSGLSHNQFTDYNVGSNGVILNNATSRTQSTQLGGIILGNPNLNGAAATTILNEVNGGSPSQLRGYTEVAGQSAHVIVANPYGITCNGCGFINTPQATLTTGKPIVENGQVSRYQVDQGNVTVEGAGLNATNVDRFEIITRSAKINAEIQAKNLTIVAGRNDVDASTLKATARADDGSAKPQLAIDSSALGGMYAGAIKLVGTEAGVGVKLDGKLIASGGDIQLDANGHLSLADTSASGAVTAKAASANVQGAVYAASVNVQTSGALDVQQNIAARDRISLSSGGQLTNNGVIEAGVNADNTRNAAGDVSLTAQSLNNSGKSVIASRNLTANVAQTLNNQGGTLSAGQASTVKAGTLDNQNHGRVLSSNTLSVSADTLVNTQGTVSSNGNLTATVGQLNNHDGEVSSAATTRLTGTTLDNSDGLLTGDVALNIGLIGALNNRNGVLGAGAMLTVAAASLDNRAGKVLSAKDMQLTVAAVDNSQQGLLSSQAGLRVDGTQLNNAGGLLSAVGPVRLETTSVDNSGGRISSKSDLTANVAQLTNRGGELVAQGLLTISGQTLDNRNGGLVGATKALKLDVDAVDNRGGEISSSLGIDIDGQRLNNSDNGKVLAGTDLGLKVAAIINQTKGLLFSTGTTTVNGKSLDNSGGSFVARQGLDIRLDNALTNVAGMISSEGTLTANAGSLDNTQGSVSSGGALSLTLDDALLNQGGTIVTDAGLTVKSASLDNRNSGTISGKQGVLVETGAFDNSQSGRLSSGANLDLTTQKLTNQDGGRIASSGALTASVTDLDQQGGQLFSNTAVTLDLNQGQLNNQGGLINAPLLVLNNLKAVNNDGGEISSAQAFTLAAQSLNNDNGKLLSNQALTLRVDNALTNLKGLIAAAALDVEAASLNNSGGTLTSRANLDLALSGQLNNQDNGLINATDALGIHTSDLNNQQGSLLGSAIAIDFGAAAGDLNNSAGLITTAGVLSLKHLRDLNNQHGEISSSQDLNLSARDLDNSAGQLISNGVLTVGARDVINQGGLLSGFKGLDLTATSLDNRNSGTLSSRDEDVGVTLSGALLNGNAGALVGKKQLTVSAASVDNRGGILSSGGDQTLTVGGLLNNALGGLIDSGNALVINAMTLGNAGGTVNAQNALSLTGTGLDNTGGQLIGNAAVTLDLLGALTNTNGKLASAGPLRVERTTQISNQGGQIASQGLLTLLTGGLDNRNRGTVAADDQLVLSSSGAVQNDADGLIYSQNGAVQIDAASLSNGKGTVQSQAAMTLTVANDIDNQSGRLQAKDADLMVVARNLDNRGGVLASLQGLLTTQLIGVLKNGYDLNNNRQGGITQAQRLNLIALGGLDNYGGRISAQTGDASVTTRNFDNRNGGLYAKGKVSVTANDFDNSGDNDGQIAGSQIDLDLTGALNNRLGIIESDSTLAIKAASLDNQTGQLRALGAGGKTEFQIGGLFDNRNGTLETANSDLSLGVGNLLNTGGSVLHIGSGNFGIATNNVINAGGSFVTRGAMTLNADSWTNSSVLQAGTLNINVDDFTQTASGQLLASSSLIGTGGNWTNDGLIASDGGLGLQLTGRYSGNGRITSLGDMTVGAAAIDLSSAASITGGGTTTIGGGGGLGSLNNDGRLTSAGALNINASTVTNHGTIAGADGLKLTASTLLNEQGGFLFSGADMALRVGSLTNRKSDVYALRDIDIALNDEGGRSALMENDSGTMESGRDFSINADSIINKWGDFKTEAELYSSAIGVRCYNCVALPGSWGDRPDYHFVLEEKYKVRVLNGEADAASISSGRNFTAQGVSFLNSNSLLVAANNISVTVSEFENSGTALGDYVSQKYYLDHGSSFRNRADRWWDMVAYNTYNDAGYDKNIHFWNISGVESMVLPKIVVSGNGGGQEPDRFQIFGPAVLELGTSGAKIDPVTFGVSQYANGIRTELPEFIKNYTPFDQRVFSSTASENVPAIIQAGGNVSITATNKITNGVERPFSAGISASPRTATTTASGSGKVTVITLNSQLPPDLAQQQINPLTLPGFTLPTGQNGLFRLSEQSAGDASSQAPNAALNWTIGSASLTPIQSQRALPTDQASTFDTSTSDAIGAGTLPARTPDFTLNRVQGLPSHTVAATPHKYLIETNPALTELKSFMSSDYLLQNLGYDPDQSAKRLGDGLFEQRLIQQAVVARTGQRFIDGQTSNEDMFKYLMNNAIVSKQELGLSVGVTLTSQQVAALTHDIVWLEEHEVNGEKVLVPVLYMAQANNRLAANGALISGQDVTLIAGKDLTNAGTLRATNNLSAKVTNDLVNSGLVEAGNRLDLLAGNNLVNKSGGIISGRDVSLSATHGDVINQRDVTGIDVRFGGASFSHRDYLDSAARIEASNDLQINAGRDVNNIGGVLQSGRDLGFTAGRDVNITSIQDRTTVALGSSFLDQTIKQYGAQVTSGRDLYIDAARDVTAIASSLDAKRDLDIIADNDLTISSAANSSDFVARGKRSADESHSVTQQSSALDAGRDITLSSGNDLGVVASKIKASGDISLDADQDVIIASGQDEASSYYYKKKKGSFGRSKTTEKQSYSSTNVASVIEAGRGLTVNTSVDGDGNVSLNGGRNVTVMGSELKAGDDLIVGATNDVAVLSATEESGAYSKKTKTGLFGLSKSGKSQLQTNVTQVGSELSAANDVVVVAGHDIAMQASEITAKNNAELHAGLIDKTGDIDLTAADNQSYSRTEEYKKKVGLSLKDTVGLFAGTPGAGADITLSSSQKKGREVVSSTGVGSQITAGNDAVLDAAQDINIVGSGVSADRNATLNAGRDVNILAGTNTHRSNSWKTDKSFGIKQDVDANGYTTFVGNETIKKGRDTDSNTAAGSLVDAGHDVRIDAGRNINQLGSDLQADNDIKLKAVHDINILAVDERTRETTTESVKRTGTTTTVAYNFGKTMDTLGDSGKGEDGVSKTSSVLKTVDALDQFFSGPKFDGHVGSSSTSERQTQTSVSNRSSGLSAGNDISLEAGNDVSVSGGRFDSGRDINVSGRNITLDVAHGAQSTDSDQTYSKGGVKGGTTGGFKLGVGISNAGSQDESTQGTSTATQLNAVGDIVLKAKNDLTLIGTEATAGKDIKLKADNDLKILSAQNASSSESNRRSWGTEGGLILGQDGIGVYGSANIGLGNLEREGIQQQEAYLYAGNQLNFESGRDTTVAGATLRGDEVIGDVGRNLTVTSVPNTGKVEGKEFDASLTVAVSYGVTVSGSVGYGQTNGKTNWVENQTVISGKNKVDIRTEDHTQLDGAVLAADNGNLKLDTGTLDFRDITGKDNEHGYYLSVSGSYNAGSGSQADKPNKGMEGKEKNSWALEGYNYNKDREQVLRATVGEGEIVVRDDKVTGDDSTAGLNRDVSKAYEVTRDEEHRTELYVTSTSAEAVTNPRKTLDRWEESVEKYGENSLETLNVLTDFLFGSALIIKGYDFQVADQVMIRRAFERQLGSRDAERRLTAVDDALKKITNGAQTPEITALTLKIADIAGNNPEQAMRVLDLLQGLRNSHSGGNNFLPVLLAGGAVGALGTALLTAASSPQNQENMRDAANSIVSSLNDAGYTGQQQLSLSAELWLLVLGTTFPVHLLDPKYGLLDNPSEDNDTLHLGSSGGSIIVPESSSNTGGSTIEAGGGSSTTSPAVDPDVTSPGVMYSSPIDYDHAIGADYKENGTPTGAHTLLNGDVRIVPGTESPPDPSGVYRASVEVPVRGNPEQWILKPVHNHTMFPAAWDEARLKSEVDAAWNSPEKVVTGSMWRSETPSGVTVRGYISPRITVYPVYKP